MERCVVTVLTFLVDWLRRLGVQFSNTLPHVATYTRELPVSLVRMYENAIDGEHLPWLHKDSFAELTIIEKGAWGWRGQGYFQPRSFMTWTELELRLDRDKNRWVTTTLRGLGKGTQIVTHALPLADDRIKVVVDFYVPKLPEFLHGLYARQFLDTYSKLYDEDLWMMATRQQELDRKSEERPQSMPAEVSLGSLTSVRKSIPFCFELQQQKYRLVEINGELVAYSTTCPHMLGPLQDASIEQGQVTCPWHGYRFDVITRQCTTGQQCKLPTAPDIVINEELDQVIARLR
jgi:nitrite reductase/ring-hydroxylating ferredoxin subunit